MAKERFDIRQHVTDTIIAQIEAGTPPWRQPWTGARTVASFPLRHNGEGYKGVNILILWAAAHTKGYASARWMTFNQAKELGGMVRKGERAAKSVFYGSVEKEDDKAETGEDGKHRIHFAKTNNVFNADQIEGLPEDYYVCPEPPGDLGTEADPALDAWFAATGAQIETSAEARAYYRPSTDHSRRGGARSSLAGRGAPEYRRRNRDGGCRGSTRGRGPCHRGAICEDSCR